MRKRNEGEKGQSLAEFALVVPVLLLLLVGIVEIGYGLNSYLTVVDSARDGARLGSKGQADADQITALVIRETERLTDGVDPGDVAVTFDNTPGDSSVTVEVCYDHPLIMGVPMIVPNPLRMCATTTMPTVQN